jgi:hypothetical protein
MLASPDAPSHLWLRSSSARSRHDASESGISLEGPNGSLKENGGARVYRWSAP